MSPQTPKPSPAYVLGVGMTKFIKPRGLVDYPDLGYEAGIKALLDAQITYADVDAGVACYVYGDSTCGQRVFYQLGMTGVPIWNVNNNCSTGSSGLVLAKGMVGADVFGGKKMDCVMVVGFEKMFPGSLKAFWEDRAAPMGLSMEAMEKAKGKRKAPFAALMFGDAGKEYAEKYGAVPSDFGEIARINHEHSSRNPYSQFQDVYTLDQIMASPQLHEYLTKLQCCPTSDGAAAAVIVSQAFLDARPHLKSQAILISGQAMTTDVPELFSGSAIDMVGHHMTKMAAEQAVKQAGIDIKDVKVCELHDCFSTNQMVTIDSLGLCEPGKAHEMVRNGDITYGGKMVINPSGGLISKGHPLGATGLAQCAELVWHLRGWANNRLVKTKVALQHNLGLGGAAVVTVYQRADGKENTAMTDEEVGRQNGLGYNPAVTVGGFTRAQADSVRRSTSEAALGNTEKALRARM